MAKKWFARAYFTYTLKACLLHPPQPGVERSTLPVVTGLFTIKLWEPIISSTHLSGNLPLGGIPISLYFYFRFINKEHDLTPCDTYRIDKDGPIDAALEQGELLLEMAFAKTPPQIVFNRNITRIQIGHTSSQEEGGYYRWVIYSDELGLRNCLPTCHSGVFIYRACLIGGIRWKKGGL